MKQIVFLKEYTNSEDKEEKGSGQVIVIYHEASLTSARLALTPYPAPYS
jgi:hypothetical protein